MELLLRKQFTRFHFNMADIVVVICFFQIRLPNGRQLRKKLDKNTTLGQLWKDILGEAEDQTNGYSGFMQVRVYVCTQWCTANADVCSEPRASNLFSFSFKPEVCQNIALFA